MKRSGFKPKTYEEKVEALKNSPRKPLERSKIPLKGSKAKKKVKSLIKGLKVKLWELCKQIIRTKYGNKCYTCGKCGLEGSSWHTGHFIPSSVGGILLRFNLNNLRPQCYYCNINLGGNGSSFYKNLVEIEGQKYVDDLFVLKNQTAKANEEFYRNKINDYEKIWHDLKQND
jgi:hypothetical protein